VETASIIALSGGSRVGFRFLLPTLPSELSSLPELASLMFKVCAFVASFFPFSFDAFFAQIHRLLPPFQLPDFFFLSIRQ
jgi:hypothetical protein